MIELLFLLLPVAAYSGWAIGMRDRKKKRTPKQGNQDYFSGLNYLLSEKPDEAIESFLNILQVKKETVEINLALGNLFRRRGEVERAIKIHQNIIARPNLSEENRASAMLELGFDYMSAGLYDRAEGIFIELLNNDVHRLTSLKQLLTLYEKTKDWLRAIEISESLLSKTDIKISMTIFHFYCELAEEQLTSGNLKEAQTYLKKASAINKNAVRANIMLGRILVQKGQFKHAIRSFVAVVTIEPALAVSIIKELENCYHHTRDHKGYLSLLSGLVEHSVGISVVLTYAEQLKLIHGEDVAHQYLTKYIADNPSLKGLKILLDWHDKKLEQREREGFSLISETINRIIASKPTYACSNCGFSSNLMYWHCPSCKNWDTIRPIVGIEGE